MPKRLLFLLFLLPFLVQAQGPRVPSRMEFAGIKLRIAEGARKEIQDDVDALTKSPKYFNIKVERARSYFPIIERVFKEEGLHDDFKYLVLQESALIPDAVSTSNAVGFWQFKDFTAQEVGMRVDGHIDERMNIVSSSRGAAKYMKKNNQFFDNWLHALQAYQMGAGGAMRVLGKGDQGANSMVINKKTYWYVKKYLAHKIAFQDAVNEAGLVQLREYDNGAGKTLKDVSRETGVSLAQLQDYNKWLKKGKIPDDREYTVIVPITELQNVNLSAFKNNGKNNTRPEVSRTVEYDFDNPDKYPVYEDYVMASRGSIVDINGMPGTIAKSGDKIPELAEKGELDLKKFLKYNDIDISDGLVAGQVYYFKKKKNKAKTHYYVIQPGESLWSVSQKFGIKLKKLKSKNRIRKNDDEVKAGRVLWLRFIRPARVEPEYRTVKEPNEKPQVISSKSVVKKEEEKAPQEEPEIAMEEVAVPVIKESDASVVKKDEPSVNKVKPSASQQYADPVEEKVEEENEEVWEENEAVEEDEQPFEGRSQVHVVKPGETLYSISRMYNITIKDLLAWNDMDISQKLSIDQKLVIYNKSMIVKEEAAPVQREQAEEIYHTVKQGDTMYNIARKYEVTIEEIMKWNDKTDFSIGLGEKIKIVKRPNK
ncbi:LysM peptidoglycan-binding domain-containing protein [Fulvivirga maritima]|uniref:LysM peptidoglycan-binding domain-containing protein n=1 Tax=Fulvivirga maritima TaxID=2904247 RepID=UPI001F3F6D3E|nr:LysM peptidoglycan-binding domain-containing protein [Fulvivirga maritima]UII29050.1 LysM peptidoglycan-binding domain-containing protein [Fulvivirga maritima]